MGGFGFRICPFPRKGPGFSHYESGRPLYSTFLNGRQTGLSSRLRKGITESLGGALGDEAVLFHPSPPCLPPKEGDFSRTWSYSFSQKPSKLPFSVMKSKTL